MDLSNLWTRFTQWLTRQTWQPPMPPNPDVLAPDWTHPNNAYHNVRVLCDLAGFTVEEKNILCACIFQESRFLNTAKHSNYVNGTLSSTDWGLCQINDYYHIGVGKDFPSVQYILDNPQIAVEWMIRMYKAGCLKMWVSYSSGAYHYWLLSTSPMWQLGTHPN